MDFVQSNLFYVVPIFGWMKLALIAYVEHNYLLVTLGYLLLCGAVILVYVLFIGYRGDFYEQALQRFSRFIKTNESGQSRRSGGFKK